MSFRRVQAEGKSWSDVAKRTRRRRAVVVSGLIGAGLILSASTSSVSARPTVVVEQADGDALAGGGAGATMFGAFATLSGDGRYYVYQGAPAGALADPVTDARTSTIYFTDRETNTTTEITPVPAGLRPGNTIRPVISGDGCTVVVITELALDVFRDDDTDARWDVYRARLPQCGGALGGWELVSTRADGSGIARDGVSVADSPAVNRSGTVIAYTHPADHLIDSATVDFEGVSAITVVDLALPIDDPRRAELVAGTPISSPNTTFTHVGLDQPALSGDGRFLAYRSDANSTEAVTTWGEGPVAGGPATRQIFAWDRNEIDPFVAVTLISARPDGTPSVTGASEPAVSRTGRVIAFTSNDVGLVPAVFPVCPQGCPTQVYRVDRDIDDNGWLDEAGRTSVTMMSAQPGSQPPIAGTASSSQPSVNADGQLVAFVTKAPNLQLVEAAGGGESTDGDLLIGDASTGQLRRPTVTSDGVRPAVGSHSRPHLSDTGRSVVFDTLAAGEIAGSRPPGEVPPVGRNVVALSSMPSLSLADADLGSTLVGLESDEWFVAVINTGTSSFVPAEVSVTGRQFRVNSDASTCALGVSVPPGGNCTVKVTFVPSGPGPTSATLTVAEEGFQAGSVSSKLMGAGGEPTLRTAAGGVLGSVVVGATSNEFLFDVQNISLAPTSVKSVTVRGAHAGDFTVSSNNCVNRPLNPRATCSVGVTFTPSAAGRRTALIEIVPANGQYTTAVLEGDASYAPTLELADSEVAAGDDMVLVGHGYPPDTDVTVVFGDGGGNRTVARTSATGDLLLTVPVSEGEHGGTRTVVANGVQGSVASAPIEIIPADDEGVGLPGFGLSPRG
jgi:hypothetical protein